MALSLKVVSIIMIGPAMDEMLASLQFLKRVKNSEASFWKAFWGVGSESQKIK